MVVLISFSEAELQEIVREKLRAESVTFDHDSEYLPDCQDGILAEVLGIKGEVSEDEFGWLEYSQIMEDHLVSLGYKITGVRYFTRLEGFGVVAMVKKV